MRRVRLHTHLFRFAIALTAAMLIASMTVFAQTDTGRIAGTLTDQNGAIVQGITVTAKNDRTGEERSATSSEDGTYVIANLRPSTYTVSVTGTLNATANNVQILVGQEFKLNLALKPGALSAVVDVTTGADVALTTDSASMNVNVSPREVQGLPVNGRQLASLELQAPGAVNSGTGTFGDIRFNGRAVEENAVRYDGIEGSAIIDAMPGVLNGEVPTVFRLQSSLENVQEFRVDSNNFPAELGTGTGGQVSIVTKSGGNKFHGSGFEYFRNSSLDAANFFDNVIGIKSPLRLNQFGGSLGGPIKKNKAFFFFSYEGYRLRSGVNTIEAVPGLASRICAAPLGTGSVACNAATAALIPAFRAPGVVTLRVGPDLFDTVQLQAKNVVNENSVAFRFDYRFNTKNTSYFRFFRDQGNNDQPDGVTGRIIRTRMVPQNGVFAFQSVLKPTLLNEAKVGYNGSLSRINGVAPTVNGVDFSALSLNIAGSVAGFALPGQGANAGVAVPGGLVRANSAQNGRGQPYTPWTVSFIDNVSWTRGNHALKFGGEVRLIRLYTDRQGGTTYTWSSINNFLTNNLQSTQFLGDLSAPSLFFNNTTGQAYAKQSYNILFAQDEWKIKPNLTLNYGLRYEYYTPLKEANNRQIYFDINTGILRDPTSDPLIMKKNNFGPRLALTWSPNPEGKGFFGGGHTVVRGGFGLYYGPGQTEDQIQPIESNRISSTLSGGAYPQDVNAIIANFVNNPNNRAYQPRAYASDYSIPEKIYQYSASVQQELPYKLTLSAAYVGSQGRNLFLRSVANRILPGQTVIADGSNLPPGVGVINRTNASGQVIDVNTVREFSIVTGTSSVQNPYAEVDYKTSGGHDSYNALQITLDRRFNSGLTINSQYTFSRSFGNTAGSNEARTSANNGRAVSDFNYDNGYNNFDIRNSFNFSALYDLPFGKGRKHKLNYLANTLLGDWQIGGIVNARSGLPLEIGIVRPDVVIECMTAAGCVVPTGAGGGTTTFAQGFVAQLPGTINAANPLPPGFIAVVNTPGGGASRNVRRPNLIAGVNPYLNAGRTILNPAAFAVPAPGSFGNVPRNFLRGPHFTEFDMVLSKKFRITETANLEFRTEVFNLFNHTNFSIPGSTLNNALPTVAFASGIYSINSGAGVIQPGQSYSFASSGQTFGLLRSTISKDVGLGTSRQIQFALRLNF